MPEPRTPTWEVRDAAASPVNPVATWHVERGTYRDWNREVGAICWDYGLACLIEAALNLRDGTVE